MTMRRRMACGLVLASIFLVILACDSSPTDPGGLEMSFETIVKGTLPGLVPNPLEEEVIRDQATWQAVWTELHAGGSPQPLPAVDFGREMVIVIVGPGCNGDTTISSIARERNELEVSAKTRSCINTLCVRADFTLHVVRLPRFDGAVRFDVERGGGLC